MRYIVLIFLFASTLLSAKSFYINVTKLSSKRDLEYVGAQFKRAGIPAIYKFNGLKYLLFSGPYESESSAKGALDKIHKYFPSARIVTIGSQKNRSRTKGFDTSKSLSSSTWYKGFFAGANFSYNNVLSSHKVESGSVLASLPKEGSLGFTLDAGYEFQNRILLSVGYSQISNKDISLNNKYVSIKYKFETATGFYPYFGLLGGLSAAKWNLVPLQNVIYIDNESSSSLVGLESGIIYPLDKYHTSLYLGYKVLIVNHTAILEADTGHSELHFKRLDNILFGVRYHF